MSAPSSAFTTGLNFASAGASPPPNPVEGCVYYDTARDVIQTYLGGKWLDVVSRAQWNLFIDDIRTQYDVDLSAGWLGMDLRHARTVKQAIDYINAFGLPERISFDHDLGEGQPPATEIMWYLINGHLDERWDCKHIKEVQIHSANPVGAQNLLLLWRGFCKEHDLVMDTCLKPCLK